jgi:lipoprotein signal peptidase
LSFRDKKLLNKAFSIGLLVIFDQLIKQTIHLLGIDWSLGKLINLHSTLDQSPSLPLAANMIASLILITIILIILFYSRDKTLQIALFLIVAGGLSNTLDRLYLAASIDYITIINLNLNIADLYIIIGTIITLIYLFRKNNNSYNSRELSAK